MFVFCTKRWMRQTGFWTNGGYFRCSSKCSKDRFRDTHELSLLFRDMRATKNEVRGTHKLDEVQDTHELSA